MKVPATPADEGHRLATLRSLNVLDTPPEERFDRLTRLARRLFGVPIALVSLVDENRQWFKSCVGLNGRETTRETSFCGHAILGDDIFLIPDALQDARFHDNPLVTGAPHVRFYAGCPLTVPVGSKVGTLCLIDTEPRDLSAEDLDLLRDLARIAEQELAAVLLASVDELTGVANRRGFEALARHALSFCARKKLPASLLFFDLDDFKAINDAHGHAEGDRALARFAGALRGALRDSDVIGRLGGDEFVALLLDTDLAAADAAVERLYAHLDMLDDPAQRAYEVRFSVGRVCEAGERNTDLGCLLARADAAMYQDKQFRRRTPA